MKAAWYDRTGPARDVLQVGEQPVPQPGPGEVLVRIHASGVNPSDTKSRMGGGARPKAFPRVIPHQDGAGVIEAVGPQVPSGRAGERVWIYEAQLGRPLGCAAQYAAVPAANAVALPDGVTFEEGACLGVPAMTAHYAVMADGPVRGQTVLVTGGAGAVGFYAVQFAKLGGARVFATVSTPEQGKAAELAGADAVIFRRDEDVAARIAALTGVADGRAVDRIVDVAFGANLETSLRVLKRNGVIATYASDAVRTPELPFWALVGLNATVRYVLVYAMDRAAHDHAIADITRGLNAGALRHHIGARFALDRIVDAHEILESGRMVGKVLVLP